VPLVDDATVSRAAWAKRVRTGLLERIGSA
jgi:hypothetical protein